MIDIEMINTIEEWGFEIEKEYWQPSDVEEFFEQYGIELF